MDFLAVGDTTIDNFIRLKDARVHCDINDENCEICMRWGDKIPFETNIEVPAVGNAANAAVAAARLGLKAALRAYVGQDENGDKCIASLKKDVVDTSLMVRQGGKRTNYHFVLWYEAERTILIKHESFDYEFIDLQEPPGWLYLSSLAANSIPYEQACVHWLDRHPQTKFAFQPGTFQIKLGTDVLRGIYDHTEVFFCNVEEARLILKGDTSPREELAKKISALGPKIAVVTDGPRGAFAYDGTDTWFMPPYPDPAPPFERTGAGDAFSSTFTAALALGKTVPEALRWAPINSMSVVQKVGAQEGLLSRDNLEEFLKNAPAEYAVKKVG